MYQDSSMTPVGLPYAGYDRYGRPILAPLSYEQRISMAREMRQQQKEYIQKRIQENFPSKFSVIYGVCMIIIGLAEIALQIVLIFFKGALYFVGHGIWGGSFCLLLALAAILLVKRRKYGWYQFSYISHAFGIMILCISLALLNGLSFVYYAPSYSKITKTTTIEANVEMIPITAVMTGIGVIGFILCLIYFIVIYVKTRRPKYLINQNAATIYPQNLAMNNLSQYPQPNIFANQQYNAKI
ncbi:unnamed protein product [Brachionus calyciflorus]|uniref:Transmembrane protein n=1 Tax=Brachionus calyciflorus TaxID=104777 RepID=A0A813UE71_9BILA|nr:unnamed protein product [Brachionus calyciflorus]